MKPPSRDRVKPARYANKKNEPRRRRKSLICSAWSRNEQRELMQGLRRQSKAFDATREINFAALKSKLPKRSVQEVESMVEALKNHVVKVVLNNHRKQRSEERRARVPIEVWTQLAKDMVGSLDEPIAFAFSQMLVICSTEPRSLSHSDPPWEGPRIDQPTPADHRTIPFRPMGRPSPLVHLPKPLQGPTRGQGSQLPTPSSSTPSGADRAPMTPPDANPPRGPTSSGIPHGTSSVTTPTNQGAAGSNAAPASVPGDLAAATPAADVTSGQPVSAPSSSGADILNVSMSNCVISPVSSAPGGATASQASPSVSAKHCPSPGSTCTTTTTSSLSSTSSLSAPTTSSAPLSTVSTLINSSSPIISSSTSTVNSSSTPISTSTTISSSTSTVNSSSTIISTSTAISSTPISTSTTISSSASTINSSATPISTSTSSTTTSYCTSTSSSFQSTRFGRGSRNSQEDFPRPMGLRCIVDFEKIYNFLSSAHRPNQEHKLTSMESAVVLDLLLSLPEELPLLDCVGLERHMIQVYSRLTSPAEMVPSSLDAEASVPAAMDSAGSQGVGTEPDGQAHSQSASTDNVSGQSRSSSQGTPDREKAGICPLNPFMVPMQLLAQR